MLLVTATMLDSLAHRWLFASGVLLISVIVMAEGDARLELSSPYGEFLSDDIYERAEDWRKPPMFESEWRAPKAKEKSRIKFGYDSVYEDLRAREDARSSNKQFDLREPKPNALFRFDF